MEDAYSVTGLLSFSLAAISGDKAALVPCPSVLTLRSHCRISPLAIAGRLVYKLFF